MRRSPVWKSNEPVREGIVSYRINDICNGCGACVRFCPVNAIQGEKQQPHHIDPGLCIECGACGRICQQMSVQDPYGISCERIKRSAWPKPVIDRGLCMSCAICLDACPVNCLTLELTGKKGDLHARPVLKDGRACIGCGFCAAECPVDAICMAVPAGEPAVSRQRQNS